MVRWLSLPRNGNFSGNMRVIALVEYEVIGDSEYRYIERVEDTCLSWRVSFLHNLLARGIVVNSIKEISVEYEK